MTSKKYSSRKWLNKKGSPSTGAICCYKGPSSWNEKIIDSLHPDCIVTGDVGYHSVKYAIDNNVFIIDAGHFGTENILKKLLAESVNDIISVNENSIRIIISDVEKNPFSVY